MLLVTIPYCFLYSDKMKKHHKNDTFHISFLFCQTFFKLLILSDFYVCELIKAFKPVY